MLAYGCSADSTNEYSRLGESIALECLRKLLHKASRRGFPGMLDSLDCMHWEWKNCPTAWAGQFIDYKHKPTVVLEAVASSNNDINVLARSPLFNDVMNEVSPHIQYVVIGNEYNLGYYLADGIYPRWATLVKTISQPDTPKKKTICPKTRGL
ncbi:unnamed protein product [Prunus armeniaca]